jgi:hypothetical protein
MLNVVMLSVVMLNVVAASIMTDIQHYALNIM